MRYPSLWDRLIANIRIEGDCWTWIGSVRRHAGGHRPAVTMRVPDVQHPRNFNACRVMCALIHGPAPDDGLLYEASHLCEYNWLCVCPDHLIWETRSQNMIRCHAAKRARALEVEIDTPGMRATECPF